MQVLALDTSSPAVVAAVLRLEPGDSAAGGARIAPLAVRAPVGARGHGELLTPAIAECLETTGLRPADLDAIVAGTGPGPYTGLRVGLVTAEALGQALDIPTYGVCSLDAIGAACPDDADLLVATDARRREVYWARYEFGARVFGPEVSRPADVSVDGVGAVAGAGGELYEEQWATLTVRPVRYPDPEALVRLAADRLTGRAAGERLTPLYLRRPDAVVPSAPKAVTP